MRRFLLALASLPFLSGCNTYEPPYRSADLAFGEALIGVWEMPAVEENGRPTRMTIEPRPIPADGVRLWKGSAAVRSGADAKGYTIAATGGGTEGVILDAYLIDCDGTRVLGTQAAGAQLAKAGWYGLVLPVHYVFRVERAGEELKLSSPRRTLCCVPLDELKNKEHRDPVLPSASTGVTSSIDALVDHSRRHKGFWDEDAPVVAHRVAK